MKKTLFAVAALSLVLAVSGAGDSFAAGLKVQRGGNSGGGTGSGHTIGGAVSAGPISAPATGAAASLCASNPALCAPAASGTAQLDPSAVDGGISGNPQPTDGPGFGNHNTGGATAINNNTYAQ